MTRKKYPPTDDSGALTRQVEILAQGISISEGPQKEGPEEAKLKRRTLDDVRRLSEHLKAVPVYERN